MGMFDWVEVDEAFGLPAVDHDWQTKEDLGPGGDQLARVRLNADRTVTWSGGWARGESAEVHVFRGSETARLISMLAGTREFVEYEVDVLDGLVTQIRRVEEEWADDQESDPVVWPTEAA